MVCPGIKVREIKVKGIITKTRLPDADYVINPYLGCQHGCIYCYSEFIKRFTDHREDWGEFVDVKINAPELIRVGKRYRNKTILLSSVTDPYQPLEAKYRLTRRILEKLVEEQPKIEILAKSRLVTRDIDVLKQFEDATVGISISTLKEGYTRELEPKASLPRLRLEALKKCREAGIKTYIFISPIFPYLTEMEEIIELANPYADYFMFENLNLRATNRRKVFDFIRKHKLELLPEYKRVYEEKDDSYWDRLKEKIKEIGESCKKEVRIYFHHERLKNK